MKFSDWRKSARLTFAEAAEIAGVTTNALWMAEKAGRAPRFDGDRAAAILAGEIPAFVFDVDGGSYNQPIVRFASQPGVAYGPGDVLRGDGRLVGHIVYMWAGNADRTEEEYQAARKFLRYWPDGPQLR